MTLNEALSNEEIAKKFEDANSMDDVLATLKEYGVETTEEELMNVISEDIGELSDDQLEDVAGGLLISPIGSPLLLYNLGSKLGTRMILLMIKLKRIKPSSLPKSIRNILKL